MNVNEMEETLNGFCHLFDEGCSKDMDMCPFFGRSCSFKNMSKPELEDSIKVMNNYLEDRGMNVPNKTNRYIYVNLPLKSGTKNYLFSVSEDAEVAYGDTLIVQTYNGHELEGTAVSNPVTLDSTFLAITKQELGIKGEIQPVVGKRTVVRF